LLIAPPDILIVSATFSEYSEKPTLVRIFMDAL